MEKMLKAKGVAEVAGVSPYKVLRDARLGKIQSVKLGARSIRFRPSDVEKYISANLRPAKETV